MSQHIRLFIALVVLASVPMGLVACLWDYDTLKQERARFPSALELITGKFPRHSPAFYQWRIADRLKKLASDPNQVNLYDDLAVAYEKTGQHAKAIETILAKEKVKPGLYETYSNLGTFHILAGDFELGLPYIDKALAINPDAHFGREKYQKWLVEYAMSKRVNGKLVFPLRDGTNVKDKTKGKAHDFRHYLCLQKQSQLLSVVEQQEAVKGVLGMMRFANHDNPLLLEALGDLLGLSDYYGGDASDAKRLATRAYLKASYSFGEGTVSREHYRGLAEYAIKSQTVAPSTSEQLTLNQLEQDFKKQLADADQWYADLTNLEAKWIQEGRDVDQEYDRHYHKDPDSPSEAADEVWVMPLEYKIIFIVSGVVVALCVGVYLLTKLIAKFIRLVSD